MTSPTSRPVDTHVDARTVDHVADDVAAAVLAVPGVSGLHGGAFGEVGTYLPGRRVTGIRLGDDLSQVHITVAMHTRVLAVVGQVREAVAGLVGGPVEVVVEDVTPGTGVPATDSRPTHDRPTIDPATDPARG